MPTHCYEEGAVLLGYDIMRHSLLQDQNAARRKFCHFAVNMESDFAAQCLDGSAAGNFVLTDARSLANDRQYHTKIGTHGERLCRAAGSLKSRMTSQRVYFCV